MSELALPLLHVYLPGAAFAWTPHVEVLVWLFLLQGLYLFGLARLHVLHLNDTKVALGSHRDLHARVGEGIIPAESLSALLTDPRLAHVAVILETPIQTEEPDPSLIHI